MDRALDYFSVAIVLDDTYAPAWAGRASAYALSIFYKYDVGLEPYELATEGLWAADRAVELDATHAGGYAARGLLRSFVGMESESAMGDFGQARDFAPNQSDIAAWEGRIFSMQGRMGDAFRAYEIALDLDPEHVGRRIGLASLAFELDDYERVILESGEALQRDSTMTMATAFQGWAHALLAQGEDCLDLDFGVYALVSAICLDVAGRESEGLAMIQDAEASLETGSGGDYLEDVVTVQGLATYYGFVGDVAKAAEWVERAFDLSPDPIDVRILGSALFDKVRDDPDDPDDDTRFSEALERGRQLARERVQAGRERLRAER
jgi:tetratricopeptide (TPR) repeat protein